MQPMSFPDRRSEPPLSINNSRFLIIPANPSPEDLQRFHEFRERLENQRPFEAHRIIEGLWLGNATDAGFKTGLERTGITHIVNLCGESYAPTFDHIEYCRVAIADRASSNVANAMLTAIPFIINALATGGRVLVHCGMGISRAPSIVIGYLMLQRNMTFDEAFTHVHGIRSIVCPNLGFLMTLTDLQNRLQNKSSIDPNDPRPDISRDLDSLVQLAAVKVPPIPDSLP